MKIQQNMEKFKSLRDCTKITWKPNKDLIFQKDVKISCYSNNYKLNYRLPKLVSSTDRLQYLYHKGSTSELKRISKYLFLKSTTIRLKTYVPFYLKTEEVIDLQSSSDELFVNHISSPSELSIIEKLNTSKNSWDSFVQSFKIGYQDISYECIFTYHKDVNSQALLNSLQFLKDYVENLLSFLEDQYDEEKLDKMQQNMLVEKVITKEKSVYNRFSMLKDKEKHEFLKFKERFPNAKNNQLCRFLIARNFDVNEATTMYEKYLEWKATVKNFTLDDFKEFTDLQFFTYLGKDKCGRVVLLSRPDRIRFDQINVQKYLIYYTYYLEIYIPSLMEDGEHDQILIIGDFHNFSMANFGIIPLKKNVEDGLNYSPERQYKFIAVGVGWFELGCWSLLKPLIPRKTVQKIECLGRDPAKLVEYLQKQIDIEVIPEYLGGRKKLQAQSIH